MIVQTCKRLKSELKKRRFNLELENAVLIQPSLPRMKELVGRFYVAQTVQFRRFDKVFDHNFLVPFGFFLNHALNHAVYKSVRPFCEFLHAPGGAITCSRKNETLGNSGAKKKALRFPFISKQQLT